MWKAVTDYITTITLYNIENSYSFKFKIYQMKTKFLLGALALPMFFAACTNEELMETPVNANLQNRIPLGDVTLDFGGVDSRLALEEGSFNTLKWSNGDDLGASLIDVHNGGTYTEGVDVNASVMYNLTTTPQTNYRYEYNNGAWASNAAMVEGNYVFYMPYAENTNRVAPLAVLPVEQTLEEVTISGQKAYTTYNSVLENAKENGNIMAVAYKFLSAAGDNNDGNKTISISFKQLYATPLISVQNYARDNDNNLTDLTVKKIVLSKTNNSNFTVKERLKFTSSPASTALAEAWGGSASIVGYFNTVLNPNDDAYEGGSWAIGDNTTPRNTADLFTGTYTESDGSHQSATITINIEEPITIAKEETFSFYAVIPGGDYTTNKLKVTFVTTDDKAVDVELPAVKINPGKRYAISGYDNEGNVDSGAAAMLAVTTKQLVDYKTPGVEIATQAELYTAVATAQKVDNGTGTLVKADLVFIPAEGVVLNDQVINMLNDKADEIASVQFNGNMVISGLTTSATVPVVVNGQVRMKNTVDVTTEIPTSGTGALIGTAGKIAIVGGVTIEEGAKVVLNGAVYSITNNGTLTIDDATSSTENVTNNGELNLKNSLTLTGKKLTNASDASINAVANTAALTAANVVNEGTIAVIVDSDNSIAGTLSINATVTFENKNVVTAAGALTVDGVMNNKKDASINITAGVAQVTTGKFTNEGSVTVDENAEFEANVTGSLNKATIDNAGTLTINENIGTINVTNASKFGVSETNVTQAYSGTGTDKWGDIYNPYGKKIGADALDGTAQQYVWESSEAITGTGKTLPATPGTYNAIKYNGAQVTVSANTSLIYVEFNGNCKLTLGNNVTLPTVQVNANEVEIAGESKTVTITKLTVAEDAVVGWNDAITFEGTVYNYGKIYGNAGTVNSSTYYGTTSNYIGTAWQGVSLTPMP